MKSIFIVFSFLLLVISCSDCDLADIKEKELPSISTKSGGDGEYDLLGYGYDVTGRYIHPAVVKGKIIDSKKLNLETKHVESNDINTKNENFIFASTAEEYTKSKTLSVSSGSTTPWFKGSLDVYFDTSSSYSAENSLAEYKIKLNLKHIYYTATSDLLSNYTTANFQYDVNNLSPSDIIRLYGTHVMTNIYLGARLSIIYKSEVTSFSEDRKEVIKAGISSVLKDIFNISTTLEYNTSLIQKNINQTISYELIGGNVANSLVVKSPLNTETPQFQASNWESSCNKENMSLVDVQNETLIPIYEFVLNSSKKQILKNAVEKYITENSYSDSPIPVYRYYNTHAVDHVYTTGRTELLGNRYYNHEGIEFNAYSIFSTPKPGMVPLIRAYDKNSKDHLYTIQKEELTKYPNFKKERDECYVYATQQPGTIPLYRCYRRATADHLYTTKRREFEIDHPDYKLERIECYVFPASN